MLICVVGCSPGAQGADGLAATYEIVVPQDRYAEVNGIRLHYLDWGGDGDLFLFVPGLSHTAHTYDAVAPAFTERLEASGARDARIGGPACGDGPLRRHSSLATPSAP